MIDIRKLKELVRLMVENDLTELDLKDQEEEVTVKRGLVGGHPGGYVLSGGMPVAAIPGPAMAPRASASAPDEASEGEPAPSAPADSPDAKPIESPMVGTFYASPSPDAPPFVSVGASVGPDTVVCIIEAMKVFNEIKAECSGVVDRVLVNSGEPVEFGQRLFLIRPHKDPA